MSRVFVVQDQMVYNKQLKKSVPRFDLSPAEPFGEIIPILTYNANPFNPEVIIKEIKRKLSDFGPDDYLLLTGNPALIGFSVSIAAQANEGKVRLLQWSGDERRYITISAEELYFLD